MYSMFDIWNWTGQTSLDVCLVHVLKHAEPVEDVDAELVDEGIIVFVLEQWNRIMGDSIGGGIFVVVELCACIQT